jgi:hypothetical protein
MKQYQIILTAIVSYSVAYFILNGTAAEYVHFAGPLNELGCAVIALTMGTMCIFGIEWKSLFNYLNK